MTDPRDSIFTDCRARHGSATPVPIAHNSNTATILQRGRNSVAAAMRIASAIAYKTTRRRKPAGHPRSQSCVGAYAVGMYAEVGPAMSGCTYQYPPRRRHAIATALED